MPMTAGFGASSELQGQLLSLQHNMKDVSFKASFTPSTPYVHKFRTELCKNFELTGKCKFGDEVSARLFIP